MQFNEKYILFASKNRQIRYIFTIFSQTFYLFILFIFFVFIHKKCSTQHKKAICQMKSLFTFSSGKWLLIFWLLIFWLLILFTFAACQLYI